MTGRFTGRGQRFGRGQGRGHQDSNAGGRHNANKKDQKKERKTVEDYVYTIGSAKQSNDFNVITKFLLNHIKKTYKYGADVVSAIEDKAPFDFTKVRPTMMVRDPSITNKSQIKAIETEN